MPSRSFHMMRIARQAEHEQGYRPHCAGAEYTDQEVRFTG